MTGEDPGVSTLDAGAPSPTTEVPPAQAPLSGAEQSRLSIEIAVVACLYFLPPLTMAVFEFLGAAARPRYSILQDTGLLVIQAVQTIPAVLYIMWRSERPWSYFGLQPLRWRDAALGLLFYIACYVAMVIVQTGLSSGSLGFRAEPDGHFWSRPADAVEWSLIVCIAVVNGFHEELVMRGYLIPRLEERVRSGVAAVLITSAMFASYHLYYGLEALIPMFAMSVVLGCIFCATRRLWPLVFCHILADIVPYVLWRNG